MDNIYIYNININSIIIINNYYFSVKYFNNGIIKEYIVVEKPRHWRGFSTTYILIYIKK